MTANFGDEDVQEFLIEAKELLDDGEDALLQIERGAAFSQSYDAIFRAFHSIKGGAGMLGLSEVQAHMHQMENILVSCKGKSQLPGTQITFFLKGVDVARQLLDGKSATFDYTFPSDTPTPAKPVETSTQSTPLDFAKQTETKSPAAKDPKNLPLMSKKQPVIYAVDDEPDILEVISDILKISGFTCKTFADPEDAIHAIQATPPDVLISDMKMPKKTGLDVLNAAKKVDPDLPVIFLSGHLDREILIRSLNQGAFAVLDKPFTEKDLINHINAATRMRFTSKLVNQAVNLILYQLTDLDDFLKQQGKEDIRKALARGVDDLLERRRELRQTLRENSSPTSGE